MLTGLRPALAVLVLVLVLLGALLSAAPGRAQAPPGPQGPAAPAHRHGESAGIRRPEQLTVGLSDEFLGQLTPDGRRLYFLSDRNTLHEVYFQDMEAARALPAFDESADVTWVRVSPDGRHLLYISFRDDAAGQLCVREIGGGGRRCLEDGSRAVQAQWMGPAEIALVSRASLQGDLHLTRVALGRRLLSRPLLQRNLTSPALSPDGRWLVYVPIERYLDRVGPGFAARAAQRLEAVRLSPSGVLSPPAPLALDLPGRTGQPAFSADGRALYFAQYFNDTNHDGTIDANDHAVLFRVPFAGDRDDAPARAEKAFPEQLTDSSWNCQYPSPAAARLIATCTHGTSLDVYSLPLDGLVPGAWDAQRLRQEIDLSTRRLDLLLLYRHLLSREKDAAARNRETAQLIALHLEREELDAAEFYARKLQATEEADPATAGLSAVLLAQVTQRRAFRLRETGRAGGGFREGARARLAALSPDAPGGPAARLMRRLLRSEIADSLGDKEGARRELEAGAPEDALNEVAVPAVLAEFRDRADALYRELDDAGALYAAERRLAGHPLLDPDERLRYARAAVRALVRGLPQAEAEAALSRERAAAAPDSELAFALTLEQAVLGIRDGEPPPAVQDGIIALYRRQTRADRRHVVMAEAGQRATERDAPRLVEALVQLYVDDVPRGTRERRRAERLYQRVMEGRAYHLLSQGRLAEARAGFAQVARATGSLESHVEYIDLRLREGARRAEIEDEYAHPGAGHSEAVGRFVRAYLLATELPHLDVKRHEEAVKQALAHLRAAWHELHGEPTARVLLGAVWHEDLLRTGDKAAAQRADIHYLIALEHLQANPRYRALVLEQLGLLQAYVGNYRIALGYLEDREKLPFPEGAAALVHHLVKAQTLLHLDRDADAAGAIDEALRVCERVRAPVEYRLLVLDRAALYNLSAGRFGRALSLYDQALPLLAGAPGALGERNRLVSLLARAAAALGAGQPIRALADLGVVDQKLGRGPGGKLLDPGLLDALKWPHTPAREALRAYRLIAVGLRAEAHRSLGQFGEAKRALEARQALLRERFERTGLDEHLRPLALAEAQLAEVAERQNDVGAAGRWLSRALSHADLFVRRAKIPVGADQLALLWFAAELRLSTGADLHFDLPARLRAAQERMAGDPALRGHARLFEIYLPIVLPLVGPTGAAKEGR